MPQGFLVRRKCERLRDRQTDTGWTTGDQQIMSSIQKGTAIHVNLTANYAGITLLNENQFRKL